MSCCLTDLITDACLHIGKEAVVEELKYLAAIAAPVVSVAVDVGEAYMAFVTRGQSLLGPSAQDGAEKLADGAQHLANNAQEQAKKNVGKAAQIDTTDYVTCTQSCQGKGERPAEPSGSRPKPFTFQVTRI